jgi:hypothetical protein
MRGTIIEHQPKRGKKTFGFSLYLGRDESGKQLRQVKRGFARKTDAEQALRDAILERQRTPEVERTMPAFAEFFNRWHAECVARECAPKTIERYHELGQYAIKRFGDSLLDALTAEQLQAAVNHFSDRGGRKTEEFPQGRPLAPKTVRHIAFLVQDCLQQAVDWDIIAKNPMLRVKKPKVPRRRPKVVDQGGFDVLLNKAAGTRSMCLSCWAWQRACGGANYARWSGATLIGIKPRWRFPKAWSRPSRAFGSRELNRTAPEPSRFPKRFLRYLKNTSVSNNGTVNYTDLITRISI